MSLRDLQEIVRRIQFIFGDNIGEAEQNALEVLKIALHHDCIDFRLEGMVCEDAPHLKRGEALRVFFRCNEKLFSIQMTINEVIPNELYSASFGAIV